MSHKETVNYKFNDFTLQISTKGDGITGVLDDENGPAIVFESKDGSRLELFVRDGKLHRLDGPALEAKGRLSRAFMYFHDNVSQPMPVPRKATSKPNFEPGQRKQG